MGQYHRATERNLKPILTTMKSRKIKTTEPKPQQSPAAAPAAPAHEKIAARAYDIYERNGYVEGSEQENWLEAEVALTRESLL